MTDEQTTPTTTKDIDPELVTVGQPTEGGCCWTNFGDSPTLPTSATTKMGTLSGWESLGELSENGFTASKSVDSTKFKGWHGSVVLSQISSTENTFKAEFIEVNRPSVAKLRYGKSAVETDTDGIVSHIKALDDMGMQVPLVFDELESNGYLRRTVIPKASIDSFDDVPHKKGDLMVYGMQFTAIKDGDRAFDIYRAKPTEA